ncbi:MAG: hypothetical protein JXR66_09310, partial [Bacteroidales bacterium]|nr:hypothetical protein [Bacteroidales bacterium]
GTGRRPTPDPPLLRGAGSPGRGTGRRPTPNPSLLRRAGSPGRGTGRRFTPELPVHNGFAGQARPWGQYL